MSDEGYSYDYVEAERRKRVVELRSDHLELILLDSVDLAEYGVQWNH